VDKTGGNVMKVFMVKCSTRWEEGYYEEYGVTGIYSTLEGAGDGMLDHSAKSSFYSMRDSWAVDDGETVYVYVDKEDAQDHKIELAGNPNFKPDWLDNVRYQIVRAEVIE
jgi:hypothetical protein